MGKVIVSKPPIYKYHGSCKSIFLAGTIDMGNSRDWQAELAAEIERHAVMYETDTVVYNHVVMSGMLRGSKSSTSLRSMVK